MDEIAEQINQEVINSLAALRIERGLTHQKLADKAGLDRSYVGLLEKGKRRPTLEVALKLSMAMEEPLSRILAKAETHCAIETRPASAKGKHSRRLNIGAAVRRRRRRAGLSQKELATRTGLNPILISQIELDKTSPTLDDLLAISIGLDIALPELIATK